MFYQVRKDAYPHVKRKSCPDKEECVFPVKEDTCLQKQRLVFPW